MNQFLQKLSNPLLVASLLSASKLILQQFGFSIPDHDLNDFANGIAALLAIIGIFKNYDKPQRVASDPVADPQPPQISAEKVAPATATNPANPTVVLPSAP